MAKKTQSPDEYARSMGFRDAATMFAYQQRQHEMMNGVSDVMTRKPPAQQPVHPAQSFLDSIMQYLPLGILQKAGNAMDGHK